MMGDVVDLEEHRPVWQNARAACLNCAKKWVAVYHEDAADSFLECPRCHEMKGLALCPDEQGQPGE